MTKTDIEKPSKSKKSALRSFYFPTLGVTIEAKDEVEAKKKAGQFIAEKKANDQGIAKNIKDDESVDEVDKKEEVGDGEL